MDFRSPITIDDLSTKLGDHLQETLFGTTMPFSSLCHPERADGNSLVYANSEKHLKGALESGGGGLIANITLKPLIEKSSWQKPVLLSPLPELFVREILQTFGKITTPYKELSQIEIHPSASIHSSAQLGTNITVGPNAFIGPGCQIGDNCYIGMGTIVCRDTQLGANTTLHPLVYIGHSSILGADCEVMPNTTIASEGFGYSQNKKFNHFRIPHGGKVIIGNDVHIGANCAIDRGSMQDTTIGNGTKLDNLVHLAHNVSVGENCLITANVTVAGSTSLGSRMMIGGSTSIDGHLKIGDDVHFQGISGVTKPLHKPGVYGGFPAQPTMTYKRNQATYMKLAELRKTVEGLVKALENK